MMDRVRFPVTVSPTFVALVEELKASGDWLVFEDSDTLALVCKRCITAQGPSAGSVNSRGALLFNARSVRERFVREDIRHHESAHVEREGREIPRWGNE